MIGLNLHNPGFVGLLGGRAAVVLDGQLDLTFIANAGTGFNGRVESAVRDWSGGIVAVGNFTSYNGNPAPYIARINSDGTFDTSYNPGSGFNYPPSGLTLDPNTGGCFVWGGFTTFNGSSVPPLILVQSNGTRRGVFDPSPSAFGGYSVICVATDGSTVYVGGGSNSALYKLDAVTGATLMQGINGGSRSGTPSAIHVVNTTAGKAVVLACPWNVPSAGMRYVIMVNASTFDLRYDFDVPSITSTVYNLSSRFTSGGQLRIMAGGYRPYLLTETGAAAPEYTLPFIFNVAADVPTLPTADLGYLVSDGSRVYRILNDGTSSLYNAVSVPFQSAYMLQNGGYASNVRSIVTPLTITNATQQGVVVIGDFTSFYTYSGTNTAVPSGILKLTYNYDR